MNHQATGPKSEAGKEISSKNAIKFGFYARKWLSETERHAYEQLCKELTEEHQPQTTTEYLLIERLATSITRLRRLTDIEDAQYEFTKQSHQNNINPQVQRMLNEFKDLTKAQIDEYNQLQKEAKLPDLHILNTINRQQNSLHRQISKELSELLIIINLRKSQNFNPQITKSLMIHSNELE